MKRIRAVGEWILLVLATLVVLGLLFVDVGPRIFPYEALIVRSGSMSPTIPTGSLVLYKKAEASQLKVGDVIVFTSPNNASERVTHRIYAIDSSASGRYFVTKGDANATPDNWRVPAVGNGWVEFWHVPAVGYAISDLQSSSARIALIAVPAAAIGVLLLLDLRKPRRGRHARRDKAGSPQVPEVAADALVGADTSINA